MLRHSTSTRPLYGRRELERLIAPRSVAVVGASATPGSFGLRTLENIRVGYEGQVFPVNPRRDRILDLACYPSLAELPLVPDCVVLAIPKDAVEEQVAQCADLGVGGVIIYASGFAELGTSDAMAAQARLAGIARESGLRIIGPNTVGIANLTRGIGLHFMPKFNEMPIVRGPIGLVSQSGGLGYTVLQAMQRGVGFSHFLSAGNSCDVDICDLVNYLVDDESTSVIACMFEGVRSGARLIEAGRRALAAGKPLLVYKMGRSELSRQTALSHTGSLTGAYTAYRAAFEKVGAVALDNWEDVLESANFFARAGAPKAPGVGVMASSGGAAVMAADKAAEYGVSLPAPAAITVEVLRKFVPDFGSISNPTDMTAETLKSFDLYGGCIRAFAEDPHYGAVVVPMMSAQRPITVDRANYLSELAATLGKPMCLVWINEWLEGPGSEVYDASPHMAMFRSMGRCMRTLEAWNAYHGRRGDLLLADRQPLATGGAGEARRLLAASKTRSLSEHQSKSVLAAYGIGGVVEELVTGVDAAVAAAARIGYPVVVKADSGDVPHKTEAGVVHTDIADEAALRAACADILSMVDRLGTSVRLNGLLVQKMVRGKVELLIGASVDPQFGPLITCGMGGVGVEIFRDVVTALAPVDLSTAKAMVSSLRAHKLLQGYRNQAALPIAEFAEIVSRVSELITDLADEIEEIDLNPVILSPTSCNIVDALVVKRSGSAEVG